MFENTDGEMVPKYALQKEDVSSLVAKHILSPVKPYPIKTYRSPVYKTISWLQHGEERFLGWYICTKCAWVHFLPDLHGGTGALTTHVKTHEEKKYEFTRDQLLHALEHAISHGDKFGSIDREKIHLPPPNSAALKDFWKDLEKDVRPKSCARAVQSKALAAIKDNQSKSTKPIDTQTPDEQHSKETKKYPNKRLFGAPSFASSDDENIDVEQKKRKHRDIDKGTSVSGS